MFYVSESRGSWGRLHTSRDCRMARSSNTLREATIVEVAEGRLCAECKKWIAAEERSKQAALDQFQRVKGE